MKGTCFSQEKIIVILKEAELRPDRAQQPGR
jgi:hypothetical protein